MAQPILTLQELSKYYVNGRNVVAGLNRVSLSFEQGEFVAITGESGSGKSASLRNFKKEEVGVINVASKPLPFRTDVKPYNVSKVAKEKGANRYALIQNALCKSKTKACRAQSSPCSAHNQKVLF